MDRDEVKELHFITTIDNLGSILMRGIVCHNRAKKLPHRSIASESVQDLRRGKSVPGGLSLHNYANLYFDARNAMMYYLQDEPDLVVIHVSPDVLDIPDTVVTDGNAAAGSTLFLPSPSGLRHLNSTRIFAWSWNDPDPWVKIEKKRIRQAEVLVPYLVRSEYIEGCYVDTRDKRRACLEFEDLPAVDVRREILLQMSNVRILEGDLLKSNMHALVNTVNTVGIMGKGVALAFKKRYPDMYFDYVKRCDRGEVRLGEPYVYRASDHVIVNFPTKQHWRSVSRLSDIEAGLDYLERHYKEWQIKSLAVPPLGCGNGQLEWRVVGPILLRHLKRLEIPVELYAPHGSTLLGEIQLDLLDQLGPQEGEQQWRLEPWLVAIAETVSRLESLRYHWPVGRVMLQKIVYFATAAGLPTGLEFQRASYGPFAPDLKAAVGRLQNNGILTEHQRGRMIEMRTSSALDDARASYSDQLGKWSDLIDQLVDLVARFDTNRAEVAATVHYAAQDLRSQLDRKPTVTEVVDYVEDWKRRRNPPLERTDILRAVVSLGTQGWLQVDPDETTEQEIDDIIVGCALIR